MNRKSNIITYNVLLSEVFINCPNSQNVLKSSLSKQKWLSEIDSFPEKSHQFIPSSSAYFGY